MFVIRMHAIGDNRPNVNTINTVSTYQGCGSAFIFCRSGFSCFPQCGSGSSCFFNADLVPDPACEEFSVVEKNKKFTIINNVLTFFLLLFSIFSLLVPDPDPGVKVNADPCGSRSTVLPHMHHFRFRQLQTFSNFF